MNEETPATQSPKQAREWWLNKMDLVGWPKDAWMMFPEEQKDCAGVTYLDQIHVREVQPAPQPEKSEGEWEKAYNTLVGLLKKRFPKLPNGNLPDYAIEDVLRENDELKQSLAMSLGDELAALSHPPQGKTEDCPACKGEQTDANCEPCPRCAGTGYVQRTAQQEKP